MSNKGYASLDVSHQDISSINFQSDIISELPALQNECSSNLVAKPQYLPKPSTFFTRTNNFSGNKSGALTGYASNLIGYSGLSLDQHARQFIPRAS